MPNISEVNQELVRAFNINLCYNNIAITNLTVQNLHGKDHIVISFDKNMDSKQCMKYLNNMKEKIIKRSYRDEKAAGVSYNLKFFPFAFNMKHLPRDDKGRKKFSVKIDKEVVFNLKCYLAKALVRDIKEKMGSEFGVKYARERIYDVGFDRNSYLFCMRFDDRRLQERFINSFSAEIEEHRNAPSDYLKVDGNLVYIKKGIFDNVEFIKDIVAYNAFLICRDFHTPSVEDEVVENLKFPIIDFIRRMGIPVHSIIRTSYKGSHEDSVLVPVVYQTPIVDQDEVRFLNNNDVNRINSAFDMEILSDVGGDISMKLPKSDSSDSVVYGIDFADVDIACCVLNKIMESSVINKDHKLSIDPELHFRALSPPRTPPNQRKENRDSSYDSNSPPKPKDSGVHSSSDDPGPSTKLSDMEWESPMRSQDGALKDSPRRGSEKFLVLLPVNQLDVPGTSREFPPRSHLSYTAVSYGVSGPSSLSQSVSAAQDVPAGTSPWAQPIGYWSSQSTSGNQWPQPSSFVSGSSLSKGAGGNVPAWTSQPIDSWSSPPPAHENKWTSSLPFTKLGPSGLSWSSSGPSSWPSPPPAHENKWTSSLPFTEPGPSGLSCTQSRPSSWKGANPVGASPWVQQTNHSSLQSSNLKEDCKKICEDFEEAYKKIVSDSSLSKEEQELFEKLLYTLNLTNYTFGGVYTNFFAKGEKIVSLLHDNVDREKYLQAVIDYIIKEYCKDEEKARKVYDFDKFPFKLNYEEKQGKTVVANISSGALSNLKILFSQKFGKNVDAIDISAVKKVEEREKDEWVDRQLFNKNSPKEACEVCFPDEGAMKIIPIAFEGGGYVLDRSRDTCEVNLLLREQLRRFRGTSLEKRKSSDKPLTEEEKELFKELLYAFNLKNYIFECSETNFIVKNGEIASLIDDSVNVKEYLQEVRDKMKEKYCVKEAYDLNEFPFKFLPDPDYKKNKNDCEKNPKMTVVANISSGALLNLKKLFIYGHEKEVKIGDIDIKIVKKVVESKRCELVNSDVKKIEEERCYKRVSPHEIVTTSYPDESALEDIPIRKYEAGYCLHRTFDNWETKSLVERYYAKGKSVAGKGSSKAEEKTSDYYSMSEHEESSPVQQQNSSQNTGGGSSKRKSEGESSPTKRLSRSGSSNSSSEEEVGSPCSNLSDSDSEELCKGFRKTGIL